MNSTFFLLRHKFSRPAIPAGLCQRAPLGPGGQLRTSGCSEESKCVFLSAADSRTSRWWFHHLVVGIIGLELELAARMGCPMSEGLVVQFLAPSRQQPPSVCFLLHASERTDMLTVSFKVRWSVPKRAGPDFSKHEDQRQVDGGG